MANIITILRILGTLLLSVTDPLTAQFYIIYSLTGVTDVLDGYIARKTNTVSELGSKLDSAADLMFYGIIVYKLFPVLSERLPVGIWYTLAGIIILRVFTYIFTAIKYKEFMSNHTYFNKITGLCAFIVPYFIEFQSVLVGICILTCVVCVTGSVYDFVLAIKHK